MPAPTQSQLHALRAADPVLAAAMDRVPPFPGFPDETTGAWTHFHSLARSIVFQQLATAAARTIYRRVCELTPGPDFPTPEEVLGLDDERLRGAGLSKSKTRAVKDLAGHVVDRRIDLDRLDALDDEAIVESLTDVWGIGPWTARMFLIFKLGRLDVMAPDDLGIREGARRLDGLSERPAPGALLERAEVWRPLRSVACWVLWRLTDLEEEG